jgi:tyrosyl-tRNA synthetase
MTLSEELQWRGLIKDKTFAELSWLDEPKTFYLGIDCSADSLTIGNLAIFMLAKQLRQAGSSVAARVWWETRVARKKSARWLAVRLSKGM